MIRTAWLKVAGMALLTTVVAQEDHYTPVTTRLTVVASVIRHTEGEYPYPDNYYPGSKKVPYSELPPGPFGYRGLAYIRLAKCPLSVRVVDAELVVLLSDVKVTSGLQLRWWSGTCRALATEEAGKQYGTVEGQIHDLDPNTVNALLLYATTMLADTRGWTLGKMWELMLWQCGANLVAPFPAADGKVADEMPIVPKGKK